MIRDILLVDDDPDDIDLFQEALNEVDSLVNFHSARNGVKALEFLLTPPTITPDLIVLDINMPEMDGWRCLTELKQTPLLKQIPAIMYSTSVTKTDASKASDLGALGIYKKPERFEELIHLLKSILKSSQNKDL
jgi:CheY-like chemotaxis protein